MFDGVCSGFMVVLEFSGILLHLKILKKKAVESKLEAFPLPLVAEARLKEIKQLRERKEMELLNRS